MSNFAPTQVPKQSWSYPMYETRVCDLLLSRGILSKEDGWFEKHKNTIRARYDMGQPEEQVVEDLAEAWRIYQEAGGSHKAGSSRSKAMTDTAKAIAVAKRLGQML